MVFVIDEFDTARIIFDLAAFQAMRELHNYPEWRVAFVTTSRHTIQEIETHADISNLAGIFHELHLGLFSVEEATEMLDSLTNIGLYLENSDLDFIKNKMGLHPYLIAIFAYHLADLWLEYGNADFEVALDLSTMTCLTYYNQLVELLHEEGTLECLGQIASGIIDTATKMDIEKLKAYDIIKSGLHGNYYVFSQHFATYLNQLEQTDSVNFLLQIGQLVGNQYRVLTGPKTTNHSQVVKAWDQQLGRQVAVKCLYVPRGDRDYSRELREYLVREGKILAQLSHPNIGAVYNIILDPPSIVMEWVEGMSLHDALGEGQGCSVLKDGFVEKEGIEGDGVVKESITDIGNLIVTEDIENETA